jgi:hypothetical protein
MQRFDYVQWKKYNDKVILLLKGDLTEWEQQFCSSIFKKIGHLTDRQIMYLDLIVFKYFKPRRNANSERA